MARDPGNQRRYSAADVDWVVFLLRLRETGMPIAQMREYAALRRRGPATTEPRLRLLEAHEKGLQEQLARPRAHRRALDEKIAAYRRDLAALQAPETRTTTETTEETTERSGR